MANTFTTDRILGKIYENVEFTGVVFDSYSSPNTRPSGIVLYLGNIYSTGYTGDKVWKHVGSSSSVSDSYSSPGAVPYGLSINADGDFISADAGTDDIFKNDKFSSAVLDSYSSPSSNPTGVDMAAGNVYAVDGGTAYMLDGFSPNVLDTMGPPGGGTGSCIWDDTNSKFYVIGGADKVFKFIDFTTALEDSYSSPGANPVGLHIDVEAEPGGNGLLNSGIINCI